MQTRICHWSLLVKAQLRANCRLPRLCQKLHLYISNRKMMAQISIMIRILVAISKLCPLLGQSSFTLNRLYPNQNIYYSLKRQRQTILRMLSKRPRVCWHPRRSTTMFTSLTIELCNQSAKPKKYWKKKGRNWKKKKL